MSDSLLLASRERTVGIIEGMGDSQCNNVSQRCYPESHGFLWLRVIVYLQVVPFLRVVLGPTPNGSFMIGRTSIRLQTITE